MKKQKIKITVLLLLFIAYAKVQSQPLIVDFAVYNFSETASTVTLNSGTTYQFKNLCTNLCEFTDYTWFIIPSTGFTIDNTKASEPSIKFAVPGSYQVNFEAYTYVVSQGWVCANQTVQKNKIGYINVPYTIPVAQFKTDGAIVSSKTITINTEVNFTDNSANYPTQWLWTVSPSTGWSYTSGSSSSKDAKIKFTANGNYTVSLKATNPAGNNTITKTTHITAKAIAPVANFNGNGSSATQINLEQNATVNFTDLSTNSPTAWAWSISPGTGWSYTSGSSTTANPTIKFTNGGVYSVSLTATNSGGSNSLTKSGYINITPAPPAVSSGITYCKGQTASQLTATGTNLKWYSSASGGTGTNTAPTPSTLNAGNTSYYVSQTVNGVESLRSLIKVIVNATSAPVVSNRNYCLGAVTSVLTASGSGLKWYSAPSGGVGSSSAPLPLSNTVGSTNYYVSQSLNGCESERANLVVTVNSIDKSTSLNNTTLSSNQLGATYQWINCKNDNSIIVGETNKDFTPTENGNYAVNISLNGCTATSNCTSIETLTLETIISSKGVNIYPIPTKGIINVELTDLKETELSIYNVTGQIILTKKINEKETKLDLSTFDNGVYFLNFKNNDSVSSKKIILDK
jgi:PKD repeat protein